MGIKKNIVWEVLQEMNNKADYVTYYSMQPSISYNDLINIWDNFIQKYIYEINNININNASLKLAINDNNLAIEIEELFNLHLHCMEDDLLLFYIKDSDDILIMLKSYVPLLKAKKPRLPFWNYIVKNDKIKEKFTNMDNFNLCIIGFAI